MEACKPKYKGSIGTKAPVPISHVMEACVVAAYALPVLKEREAIIAAAYLELVLYLMKVCFLCV